MDSDGFLNVFGEFCISSIIEIPETRDCEGLNEIRLNPSKTELLFVDQPLGALKVLINNLKRVFLPLKKQHYNFLISWVLLQDQKKEGVLYPV